MRILETSGGQLARTTQYVQCRQLPGALRPHPIRPEDWEGEGKEQVSEYVSGSVCVYGGGVVVVLWGMTKGRQVNEKGEEGASWHFPG